jgi:rare lipoprotein A
MRGAYGYRSRCAAFIPPCSLAGTWRRRKQLLDWAGFWGETMIRPICAALSVICFSASADAETCVASRYGYGGSRTASGERMDPNAMTAAHRTRPFGTHITVTSHSTGRSVTVRINDRGPFIKGRCIDLSTGAARVLGMAGTAMVSLQ